MIYRQTSNISHTLVGNTIVDHSHVVGAAPVGWDLVWLVLEVWRYVMQVHKKWAYNNR